MNDDTMPLFDLPGRPSRPTPPAPPTAQRSLPRPVQTWPTTPASAPVTERTEEARPRSRFAVPPAHPESATVALAEKVTEAWFSGNVPGRIELPLSALAATAFLGPDPEHAYSAAKEIEAWDADHTVEFMRQKWRHFGLARPDLINPASPFLLAWWGEKPISEKEKKAVHEVVQAAVKSGIFLLTLEECRYDVDLFGITLTMLKAGGATRAGAAYYTPSHIADVMANVIGLGDGESINDPASGTGGLFRAAAALMRAQGRNPHDVEWVANDIDELAIACLAANSIIWDLGYKVVLAVGDTLTELPVPKAKRMRAETVGLAVDLYRWRRVLALLDGPTSESGPK
ncbi:N-6 DNA methylase [Nocardiopsis flavescens]|uniref:N-6 DNA methylase n=1 Tax=Nocardiopsis flavescens TaxID=758803 RepID=UPI00364C64CF